MTFYSVTMRSLNISKMQKETRFQNNEHAFSYPLTPLPENGSLKCLSSPGYSLAFKSMMATIKTDVRTF